MLVEQNLSTSNHSEWREFEVVETYRLLKYKKIPKYTLIRLFKIENAIKQILNNLHIVHYFVCLLCLFT